jgi:ribosomal protein S15
MLLRRTFASAGRSLNAAKEAVKEAVRPDLDPKYRGKLDRIARPFQSLLTSYTKPGEVKFRPTGLGFRLSETDLEASELNERVAPTVKRLLSLEMSGQSELKRHQVHQAMEQFCRKPNDTGSPEVQAAVWSVKIAALEAHVREYLHDYVAERKIVEYKDQRRKILKYLMRVSLARYYGCLDRLGLPHDLVEAARSRFPNKPTKKPKTKEGLRKLQSKSK